MKFSFLHFIQSKVEVKIIIFAVSFVAITTLVTVIFRCNELLPGFPDTDTTIPLKGEIQATGPNNRPLLDDDSSKSNNSISSATTNDRPIDYTTNENFNNNNNKDPTTPNKEEKHNNTNYQTTSIGNVSRDDHISPEENIVKREERNNETAKANNNDNQEVKSETIIKLNKLQQQQQQQQQPYFVLHFGPDKTGTSSFQQFMVDHKQIAATKDDYLTIMRADPSKKQEWDNPQDSALKTLQKQVKCMKKIKCQNWNVVYASIRELIKAAPNKNVIWSNEQFVEVDFDTEHWQELVTLVQSHYRFKVIMVYRRFFEWLPSHFNQHYKDNGPFFKQVNKWEENGGIALLSFSQYFDQLSTGKIITYPSGDSARYDHLAGKLKNTIFEIKNKLERQHNIEVSIASYYTGDIVEEIACNHVPMFTFTCVKSRQLRKAIDKNPAQDLASRLIAQEAKRASLILDPSLDLRRVRHCIDRFYHSNLTKVDTSYKLPQKCPAETITNRLKDLSYEFEVQLMPSMLSSHNETFDIASNHKQKFCDVDAQKVIQDITWSNFLKSLRKESKC